jgi:ribosomal subunit interface protein
MTFPTINYKATNTDMDPAWQTLVEQKFSALEKYLGEETDVRCEVEFRKESTQQSGEVFTVEANLWLAGTLHRAEATEANYETAIDEVQSELDKELRRAHKKQNTLMKRGGRMLKNMMHFGG